MIGGVGFTIEVGFTDVGSTEDIVFDAITGAEAVGAVVGGNGACGTVFITGTGDVVLVYIVVVVTEEDKASKVLVGVEVDNTLVEWSLGSVKDGKCGLS